MGGQTALRRSRVRGGVLVFIHINKSARIPGHVELEEQGTEFPHFTFLREPVAFCASRFQYQIESREEHAGFDEWIGKESSHNATLGKAPG